MEEKELVICEECLHCYGASECELEMPQFDETDYVECEFFTADPEGE
jgi:hypothetical protein